MRKRILLTAGSALALTVGMTGVAHAATVVQTTDGTVNDSVLPKTAWQNIGLSITTSVRDETDPEDCASADPPADSSCTVPPKASLARVDFDLGIRFNTNAIPKCSPASVAGKTTEQARNTCPGAFAGGGPVAARGGSVGGPTTPGVVKGTVSVFNSTNSPGVVLHVDLGALGALNLNGTLTDSPLAGYGRRLVVPVPETGAVLTHFSTSVNRGRFVQGRCNPSPLDFHGLFNYSDTGGGTYPASAEGFSNVPCTIQVEPYLSNCKAKARRRARRAIRRARRTLSGAAETRAIRRAKRRRARAIRRCIRLHAA